MIFVQIKRLSKYDVINLFINVLNFPPAIWAYDFFIIFL